MPPQNRAAEPDHLREVYFHTPTARRPTGLAVHDLKKGTMCVCGIVGYVGREAALPFLLDGLRALEYRGYDSAGVALVDGDGIRHVKQAGRLESLLGIVDTIRGDAHCGIGHTRWATHGPPTDVNAHPHHDCKGRVAAVHNGIIENYQEIRARLTADGHVFLSETDTEVIPHLLEHHYHGDLWQAVSLTARELKGAYAFLAVTADDPMTMVAVREASPLVIGLADHGTYVASDLTALVPYTRSALVLDNGEMAVIRPDGVEVRQVGGRPVTREPFIIDWDREQASRGGYAHFMLKEIREQPEVWRDTLGGRIHQSGSPVLGELGITADDLASVRHVRLVAAGSAYHAGLVAAHWLERVAKIPAAVEVASEFRYRDAVLPDGSVVWAVSQSGETLDTLAAVDLAKRRGVPVWAVANVVGSTLAREADRVAFNRAGPEVSVCSTKVYTSQLVLLALWTLALAEVRGLGRPDLSRALESLPPAGALWLDHPPALERVAHRLKDAPSVFYVGRGQDYLSALEGQLKFKEITYIHAEAYPAGELKHGTLALVEDGVPVVAVVSNPELVTKTRSNIMEVRARGGYVVGIVADELAPELADVLDDIITVPTLAPEVMPVLMALPMQLLAYHTALALGVDIDKPRNLAKSVTVE
jgi:glucosamine--fructose-6-phosphate aminotransferase (isomerizing)